MSTVINLRVSEEDAASWKASAKAEGVSLSRWIRDRVGTPGEVSAREALAAAGALAEFVMPKRPGTPRPVRETPVRFGSVLERDPSGKLDPRCVQAHYHWKGHCRVCGG